MILESSHGICMLSQEKCGMSRFPSLAKTDGLKFVRVGLHLILIEPLKNGRAVTLQNLCICIMVGVRQSVVISIVI